MHVVPDRDRGIARTSAIAGPDRQGQGRDRSRHPSARGDIQGPARQPGTRLHRDAHRRHRRGGTQEARLHGDDRHRQDRRRRRAEKRPGADALVSRRHGRERRRAGNDGPALGRNEAADAGRWQRGGRDACVRPRRARHLVARHGLGHDEAQVRVVRHPRRLCATGRRSGPGREGDGRRRVVEQGLSQAGFRARQPHGAGRRWHGVQHGRRSHGRRRPARRHVPGCRRPRLCAGVGDRPGRHGGTSRARLPDDRQPDDRSAGTGRAHGRGDPGGPRQQRDPRIGHVAAQPALAQAAGAGTHAQAHRRNRQRHRSGGRRARGPDADSHDERPCRTAGQRLGPGRAPAPGTRRAARRRQGRRQFPHGDGFGGFPGSIRATEHSVRVPLDRSRAAGAVAAAQKQGRLFPYSNHNPDFFVELPAVTLGAQINTVAALALLGSKP